MSIQDQLKNMTRGMLLADKAHAQNQYATNETQGLGEGRTPELILRGRAATLRQSAAYSRQAADDYERRVIPTERALAEQYDKEAAALEAAADQLAANPPTP